MDESNQDIESLVQCLRLALEGKIQDLRMYAAMLQRKYGSTNPGLARRIEELLNANQPPRSNALLRKAPKVFGSPDPLASQPNLNRSSLVRDIPPWPGDQPILPGLAKETIAQILLERERMEALLQAGLQPTRSAIFTGPPGVGKTATARWIAKSLNLPIYSLDLSNVMSSYLGRSGINIREALDFAKSHPCVFLIDEIDAIAKTRTDQSDVGELKRIVTVILQEVDEWPYTSLLLSATNHPDIIDAALWRRFDHVIELKLPSSREAEIAILQFLNATHLQSLAKWAPALSLVMAGSSFSEIEKAIFWIQRHSIVNNGNEVDALKFLISRRTSIIEKSLRLEIAKRLQSECALSQHLASELTGVSRDTIRKHTKSAAPANQ